MLKILHAFPSVHITNARIQTRMGEDTEPWSVANGR